MNRIHLEKDIRPLSEFRANVATFVQRVNKTSRPLVITTHGRSTAVLLNVSAYESILEKLELLQDIQKAEKQLSRGKAIDHKTVKKRLLKRFRT